MPSNKRSSRRQRQVREQSRPGNPSAQQRPTLRRTLGFRSLKCRLYGWNNPHYRNWNPAAWLWPPIAEAVSTRAAATLLMRHGAKAMMLVVLIQFVLSAVPLQLTSPSWYLQVLAYFAENVTVLVAASVLAMLSLAMSSHEAGSNTYQSRLLKISRFGYILAVLLLPLQLGLNAWLFGQTYSTIRIQRTAIRANADALISGANQSANIEQFNAYLRSRDITSNMQLISEPNLAQIRAEFIRSVKANQLQEEKKLDQTVRSTTLKNTISAIKLFVSLLILASFMRIFEILIRRSSKWRPTGDEHQKT